MGSLKLRAGTLDAEYTITCELPREKAASQNGAQSILLITPCRLCRMFCLQQVGLLIGKRGEDVQRIRRRAQLKGVVTDWWRARVNMPSYL